MNNTEAILAKIQKCLNLANSSNANEAATALRQAQKLMEMHKLTPEDVKAAGYTSDTVNTTTQPGKNAPMWSQHLAALIDDTFGTEAIFHTIWQRSGYKHSIRYFGPAHRVALAKYTHAVLVRSMNKAWDEYKSNPFNDMGGRNARTSFFVGWLAGVRGKVSKMTLDTEEKAGIALAIKKHTGGTELEPIKMKREAALEDEALYYGRKAAKEFDIHTPMNGGDAFTQLEGK